MYFKGSTISHLRIYVGSGGKKNTAADGHSYHVYTYTYDCIHLFFKPGARLVFL